TITNTIQTNGKIEPVQNFEAHAPSPTTVNRVLVVEGDHVKKGQLLVQLEDAGIRVQAAKARAQVKNAQADLDAVSGGGTHQEVLATEAQLIKARGERDSAQRNLEALQRLEKDGNASAAEVTAADNRLKAAQADLDLATQQLKGRYSRPEVERVIAQRAEAQAAFDAAEELLKDSNVSAPHDGEVYNLPVKQGQFVNTGDLLVQVADLSTVQVRGFVDEPDIGRLAPGQQVNVTWDALPGRAWVGKVTRVPTTVSVVGTRTVGSIVCAIDNQDHKLLPNINVNLTVMTARHENVLTVSREAMHQEDSKHFVYEISDGELKRRDVQTAVTSLTRVEVTEGLQPGTEVALSSENGTALRPGLRVEVVQR
ncbi:MAG TPA: efflux RND transporter periplasmic adaptor subunit, partial [Terriglobales bacterium]|nr:efflux RND transporter periplasmic adaptor subunit [Terriglobales bacterium]